MDEPARILVVDDEPVVLDAVRRHLRKDGYELEMVGSGRQALEALARAGADVVLTDLMMPEMDGLELLERIREEHEGIPVILITGYATLKTGLLALRKGAYDYVAKPFTREELRGVVARAVRLAKEAGGEKPDLPLPADARAFGHCWIVDLPDGSRRLGMNLGFALTVGRPEMLDLPSAGDFLEEGSACLKLLAGDGKIHVLWTPIAGSVLEVNPMLSGDPQLVVRDPYGEGWLLRVG